jgi:uncharacterized Fe-S cluster-containing radical SAM superfamily enzyme
MGAHSCVPVRALRERNDMDLKQFYHKLRIIEEEIAEPHVVVVTHETGDGGRAGSKVEVSRRNAARLILEGRAHLATVEEVAAYRNDVQQALQDAQQRTTAERLQVNLISDADLRAIKSAMRQEKR